MIEDVVTAGEEPMPEEGAHAGQLTLPELEALLFVAERPLSRREIASLAGVPVETVDDRLGDLEVALRERGIRLVVAGERVELATAPEAGGLIARYVGADGVRLSPAALETLFCDRHDVVEDHRDVTAQGLLDFDRPLRSKLHGRTIELDDTGAGRRLSALPWNVL